MSMFPQALELVSELRGVALPEPARLAGYTALIDGLSLEVPLPRRGFAIGQHHRIVKSATWTLLTPRHQPAPTIADHLIFALKNEGVELSILKRVFEAVGPEPVTALVRQMPTSSYARRLWFFYEWLMGQELPLVDVTQGSYVDALDTKQQYAGASSNSRRHRVRDNLPGTPAFCPLVYRTTRLDDFIALGLSQQARSLVYDLPPSLIARAAAFLLLGDSRASFSIEGELPDESRAQRWAGVLQQAGAHSLDMNELERLQRIVIGDARFVRLGLRREFGFVGVHEQFSKAPIPEHISAHPDDLPSLMGGLLRFDEHAVQGGGLDPVISAAVIAFGFVYIHPFVDGNGRLHRYLIHHMLAKKGFSPAGMVFPISNTMREDIHQYRDVLRSYSSRLLPVVRWRATPEHNITFEQDTVDLYRYFDATPHAEFLYQCIERTITTHIPRELQYLMAYDTFKAQMDELVDMPERTLALLLKFLEQGKGALSKRAREREFAAFTDDEVALIEGLWRDCFSSASQA